MPSVARPNMRLNQRRMRPEVRGIPFFGRSIKAASAGLNESALNAEKINRIAMVMANCW